MKELGNTRTCYCYGNMRYYAVANNNYDDFVTCCYNKSGYDIAGRC